MSATDINVPHRSKKVGIVPFVQIQKRIDI